MAHPAVEVAGVDPVHQRLVGGRDLLRRRQRLDRAFFVLPARQVPLLEHLREHHVAPFARRRRLGHRVVAGRRLDDPGQQRRLPRPELLHAQRVFRQAAVAVGELLAEVGLRGRLDPVGAVAEVDRVEVLGEDLQLRPVVGQVERQRRLLQLLEDRAVRLLPQRVLDELLLDRGCALHRALVQHVGHERPRQRAQVDAAVGHEALVLDRDHRVAHDRRDLLLGEEDLVALAQHPDRRVAVVQQHRVARVVLAVPGFQVRQVRGHGHEHAERERDEAEQRERQEDQQEAQLLQARGARTAEASRPRGVVGQRDGLHRVRESNACGRELCGQSARDWAWPASHGGRSRAREHVGGRRVARPCAPGACRTPRSLGRLH